MCGSDFHKTGIYSCQLEFKNTFKLGDRMLPMFCIAQNIRLLYAAYMVSYKSRLLIVGKPAPTC